jgi:hypothetical protein
MPLRPQKPPWRCGHRRQRRQPRSRRSRDPDVVNGCGRLEVPRTGQRRIDLGRRRPVAADRTALIAPRAEADRFERTQRNPNGCEQMPATTADRTIKSLKHWLLGTRLRAANLRSDGRPTQGGGRGVTRWAQIGPNVGKTRMTGTSRRAKILGAPLGGIRREGQAWVSDDTSSAESDSSRQDVEGDLSADDQSRADATSSSATAATSSSASSVTRWLPTSTVASRTSSPSSARSTTPTSASESQKRRSASRSRTSSPVPTRR